MEVEGFKVGEATFHPIGSTSLTYSDNVLGQRAGQQAEQEQRALEATIRARLATDEIAAPTVALSTVRADNEIKPGAPINVRIVDPAASKTAGIKVCAVRLDDAHPAFLPAEENILSGAYPVSRDLYYYTARAPKGAVKDFLAWVLSEDGQAVVVRAGYFPVRKKTP